MAKLKSLIGTTFEIPYNMDFNTCIDATLQAGTFECTINGQYDIKYIFWEDGEASGRTNVDRLVEFQYIAVGSIYVIRNGSATDGMYDGWYLVNDSGLTPLGETITISNITSVEATSEGFTDILLANNVDIKNGDWTFDTPHVLYNGSVIQELSDKEITILCAGKKMLSDIVIVNPAVEEESEPEIGTFRFEEMLLSTSKGETIVFNFNFEVGMTWAEFVNSEYNTPTSVYPSNLKDVVVFINDNDEVQIRYTEPDVTPYDYTTETYVQTIGTQTCNKDDVIKNGYNYVHSSGESGGAN